MLKRIVNRIGRKDKVLLKQEALLMISLLELGLDVRRLRIKVNHIDGISYVNDIKLGLVFPKYFFDLSRSNENVKKTRKYYFSGHDDGEGTRLTMMKKFISEDSLIEVTERGRKPESKGAYNHEYFQEMAKSTFSLCPHQKSWPYKNSVIWTYRFVESCMAFSLPVIFHETKLSESFIEGFDYIYDDVDDVEVEKSSLVKNFELALIRFTISEDDKKLLMKSAGY